MAVSLPDGTPAAWVDDPSGNWSIRLGERTLPPRPAAKVGSVDWYVPYTAVHPRTAAAAPPDARWVDVSAAPVAYFAMLHEIWGRGRTFALLEHDVVCRPDIVESLEQCPEPWCLYGYSDMCHPECQEAWRNQLGCTRFRAELLDAVPDAMSSIPAGNWDWHNVCDGLGNNLRAAGFSHHWHSPVIEHHRETHKL